MNAASPRELHHTIPIDYSTRTTPAAIKSSRIVRTCDSSGKGNPTTTAAATAANYSQANYQTDDYSSYHSCCDDARHDGGGGGDSPELLVVVRRQLHALPLLRELLAALQVEVALCIVQQCLVLAKHLLR